MRLGLAALLALLASAAGAEDTCLSGGSTLPDQRAVAALRASTEAACPCANAASRSTYQRCARNILDQALAVGTLRAACRKTVLRANAGAVCGSSKVACGRVQLNAKTAVSCRVKPTSRCSDRGAFTETPCTAETRCTDVVDRTAGTCVDVLENGSYVPGVRTISYVKPSAVDPSQQRVLDTVVWYPAEPGSGPVDPGYGAVIDAPAATGSFPLLMFSHGSCGWPLQSRFLTPLLASYGFIVAAPPHPGNTIFELPACRTVSALAASAVERPRDILFVLDQLLAANLDAGSPFVGRIDESRLGMSGHSFGGLTTYLAVQLEPRFKVAMPLAPAVPGMPVLAIPSLTMLASLDSSVSNVAIRAAYAAASAPKYLVEIQNAGHYAFSDGCFPSPDCNPPTTLTQAEAHEAVLRWVVPFLEVHLAGDTAFRSFLAPPPPVGSLLESQE